MQSTSLIINQVSAFLCVLFRIQKHSSIESATPIKSSAHSHKIFKRFFLFSSDFVLDNFQNRLLRLKHTNVWFSFVEMKQFRKRELVFRSESLMFVSLAPRPSVALSLQCENVFKSKLFRNVIVKEMDKIRCDNSIANRVNSECLHSMNWSRFPIRNSAPDKQNIAQYCLHSIALRQPITVQRCTVIAMKKWISIEFITSRFYFSPICKCRQRQRRGEIETRT